MLRIVYEVEMAYNWFRSIFVIVLFKCHKDVLGSCLQDFYFSYVNVFLHIVQVIQKMTLVEMHVNQSFMLIGCLGPEILVVFWIKG